MSRANKEEHLWTPGGNLKNVRVSHEEGINPRLELNDAFCIEISMIDLHALEGSVAVLREIKDAEREYLEGEGGT